MASYLDTLIKSLPISESSYSKRRNFTIDENDQLRLRKTKLIKIPKNKKIDSRIIFKQYKNLRSNFCARLNKELVYMYFTWDLATSIILNFEKVNTYTITHTWGDKYFFKNMLSLENIDNKAELGQSKLLLGKTFQSSQKTRYFRLLKIILKIKSTFLSIGNKNRGVRFLDFLKEDFETGIIDANFLNKKLIPIFRDLLKHSLYLHNKSLLNSHYFLHNQDNLISTRHSGQERLKLEIIEYLQKIPEEEIIKYNKKISPKNKYDIKKFTSLTKLCSFSYEDLLKIKNQYENKNISSVKESSEIIFFEKANYLKNNEDPNFERIFRRWAKEDSLFKNEIQNLILPKKPPKSSHSRG